MTMQKSQILYFVGSFTVPILFSVFLLWHIEYFSKPDSRYELNKNYQTSKLLLDISEHEKILKDEEQVIKLPKKERIQELKKIFDFFDVDYYNWYDLIYLLIDQVDNSKWDYEISSKTIGLIAEAMLYEYNAQDPIITANTVALRLIFKKEYMGIIRKIVLIFMNLTLEQVKEFLSQSVTPKFVGEKEELENYMVHVFLFNFLSGYFTSVYVHNFEFVKWAPEEHRDRCIMNIRNLLETLRPQMHDFYFIKNTKVAFTDVMYKLSVYIEYVPLTGTIKPTSDEEQEK